MGHEISVSIGGTSTRLTSTVPSIVNKNCMRVGTTPRLINCASNFYFSCFSSTSYDEHIFELVLPKTCCIGHVDVKFSLHPLCTSPPNIQVTLLKQNISNIGRHSMNGSSSDVDSAIDFNIYQRANQPMETDEPRPSTSSVGSNKMSNHAELNIPSPASSSAPVTSAPQNDTPTSPVKMSVINNVLEPTFLKRYAAEILCGPVDMAANVDLSGHTGVITLSSPQLLKVRTRSFLVHIKALQNGKEEDLKKVILSRCLFHPWLAEIPASVGSREVAGHIHEWLLLKHLPGCRLGPLVIVSGDPTYTGPITQPELRQISTNQQWGLVGVSVASWDPFQTKAGRWLQ